MDTCDQCGPAVLAKFIAALPSGGNLTFCGHCTNAYRDKLEADGAFLFPIREQP